MVFWSDSYSNTSYLIYHIVYGSDLCSKRTYQRHVEDIFSKQFAVLTCLCTISNHIQQPSKSCDIGKGQRLSRKTGISAHVHFSTGGTGQTVMGTREFCNRVSNMGSSLGELSLLGDGTARIHTAGCRSGLVTLHTHTQKIPVMQAVRILLSILFGMIHYRAVP
jgi:hypothetical protein